MKLFLFDIDGTLVRKMPPIHRLALAEAAQRVYGRALTAEDFGQTAGMTDTAILRRALLHIGASPTEIAAGLPACYVAAADAYDRMAPESLRDYHTPHAQETVARLADAGAALGLVTGNIQRIAWTKLGAAGLASYFQCGAFGDEAEARDELPPLALTRAHELFGAAFALENVYVVGDTPADIACGAASQLRTVAVATGPIHALEDLRACGPDYVFADLRGLWALDV